MIADCEAMKGEAIKPANGEEDVTYVKALTTAHAW